MQKSLRTFAKAYGHGKMPGPMKKCRWDTVLDEHVRCHVSKRRWIDWTTDTGCTKCD